MYCHLLGLMAQFQFLNLMYSPWDSLIAPMIIVPTIIAPTIIAPTIIAPTIVLSLICER